MSTSNVRIRAYASPGCVLLAFDWPDGSRYDDFLGFAIQRDPGYTASGDPQYLLNKLDFVPLARGAKPRPSNEAPIQKFNWWDGGIQDKERGNTFRYTVTPVRGTGSRDLQLVSSAAASLQVKVPQFREGHIATYFNRAVVSAQSFTRLKDRGASLEQQMDWLANGLNRAIGDALQDADTFDCVIYHLTDERWVLPELHAFKGKGTIVYHQKATDQTTSDALARTKLPKRISGHPRSKISSLMHDKFIVRYESRQKTALLMGSTNFTPEGFTVQANLLHIFYSRSMAALYEARARLLQGDPTMASVPVAEWADVQDVPGTAIRVFFSPERKGKRQSLDTIVDAVKNAKSSVLFCVFSPTDSALLTAILGAGDQGKILYGMLNSIPDPTKPPKPGKKKRPPAEISVELYNRSRRDKKVLQYDYFGQSNAPQGFLPELYTVDVSRYSGGHNPPIAVHIHHKFIIIDGDTDHPTIYTGSANFSKNSTEKNDENLVEIKGNGALAQVYVAEFMRIYNHYRARAIWDQFHPRRGKQKDKGDRGGTKTHDKPDPLVLKTKRSDWDRGAYTAGSPGFLSRTKLL